MTAGVAWALVAAVGFGFTQAMNRKSNLVIGPFRTAFGLLAAVEALLIVRMVATGEYRLLAEAPVGSLAAFSTSAVIHYGVAWTLLALSQQQIGVARTGAVTSAAPLVGTILAAIFLGESLSIWTAVGVVLVVAGVALVSISRSLGTSQPWVFPTYGLAVALCWGVSPMFIRLGLRGLDAPVLGLTVGLGVSLVLHALVLRAMGAWQQSAWRRPAIRWMLIGGVTGAVGIGAQWISFGLTTVAIAITVQQLAVLIVVALAPLMFDAAFERVNLVLMVGTAAVLTGSSAASDVYKRQNRHRSPTTRAAPSPSRFAPALIGDWAGRCLQSIA